MAATPSVDYGAILTGGAARRMGGRKADTLLGGVMLVELTLRAVQTSCRETLCVGGSEYLSHLGVPTIPDLFPGADSMGGIATALKYALDRKGPDAWVLVVGCDMPLINPALLALLAARRAGRDLVTPHVGAGFEPMCSLYRAGIYPAFRQNIEAGNLRIRDVFSAVDTEVVRADELKAVDPELLSFMNVNSPEDLARASLLALKSSRAEV